MLQTIFRTQPSRSPGRLVAVLLVLLALGAAPPAGAQGGPYISGASLTAGTASPPTLVAAQALPAQVAPGLPDPSVRARSMRPYWHVFIAFGVTWLLLLGYVVTLGRRFSRLEEEVHRLQGGP